MSERDTSRETATGEPESPGVFGLLAELPTPAALVTAARRVRESGIRRFDAHSPFPVHGVDGAIGVRMTRLPWLVLVGGLVGLSSGLLLQWWTNAVDYPFNISGKPVFSLPANIPVIFELTVLCAALCAFVGVLVLNVLPSHHHPLFASERFAHATSDRFFLSIEAADERFDASALTALLQGAGATAIETVLLPPASERRIPRAVGFGAVILVVASLVPFVLFARARVETTQSPPIDLISDMDAQPRYGVQAASAFFANGRAWREQVSGTVSREDTTSDARLWQGKDGDAWAPLPPASVPLDEATMRRGQERFAVYCAPCHGLAGGGDGPVARRADELREGTWVTPTALTADHVRAQSLGQLVGTITNGIRNMPAYGPQIAPADRWAIALYVRALQRSQGTTLDDVPPADRPGLQ